ncbi:MAG: hypothetical protein OEN55_10080 [Alphaproteobacteria bacterium]|nr:hypothetical protein [Alphaproteobacteria bacterium]
MARVFRYQGYHLLLYVAIGAALYAAVVQFPDGDPQVWGLSAREMILLSWTFAALHQGWIVFFWRTELYYGKISAWFGPAGFAIFRIGFVAFASCRLLLLIPISMATAETASIPRVVSVALIAVTTPFILWGLYSVFVYFGATRAFGADHFDPAYRKGSLEQRGIFKYIANSMYTVVLLLLYHPGLLWHSWPGLITAAAHHALVWTHYFCTEKPDMKAIYGARP